MIRVFSYSSYTSEIDLGQLEAMLAGTIDPATKETLMTAAERIREEEGAKIAKVLAGVLLRQLEKRFGPVPDAVTSRVLAAGLPDLELWADRVLDAPTLAAVFAPA